MYVTMCMIYALLRGILVLATIAEAEDDDLKVIPIEEVYPSPPSPPKRGLLISENAPVWVAYSPIPDGPVEYTKYHNEIVKDAMYGIKGSIEHEKVSPQNETSKCKISTCKSVEISFLVVMDYKTTWKLDDSQLLDYIKEKIRYAVAFWNGFDIQLRHFKDPIIRLRMAGIVIGRNKEAMPYLRESETGSRMNATKALRETSAYWRNLSKHHTDFSTDSYHFVAVMTDSEPNTDRYWSYYAHGCISLTFLFNDDLWFRSLPPGGLDNMKEIADVLQSYSKVQLKPYDHLSPGNTIHKTILPGEYYTAWDHCRANGWDEGVTVCVGTYWNDAPCQDVRCVNKYWYSKCTLSGRPPLIGSPCDPVESDHQKICLENKCQDRPPGYT